MAHRDVMQTTSPSYEYEFTWSIKDLYHTSVTVKGPTFYPIRRHSDKFCFEVEFERDSDVSRSMTPNIYHLKYYLKLWLLDLSDDKDPYRTVHGKVVLRNKRKVLCENNLKRMNIDYCTLLIEYEYECESDTFDVDGPALLFGTGFDGEVTLSGSLKFAGYLKTSVYSVPVPKFSEDCGDLAQDFKSLYEDSIGSDVTLTVGGKSYPAHKSVLAARSVVFAKMFEHPMLEGNTNRVTIKEDVDPDTFNEFMLFLYTGCLKSDLPAKSVVVLYSLARYYQVKSLCKTCLVLLGSNLTVDSVCEALVLAYLHNDDEFKGIAKAYIRENFFDVVGTGVWAEIITTKPELTREVLEFVKPVS